jgi:hypothetical protein
MVWEHNENLFLIHTPSILHGAPVAVGWVWPSCTKWRLMAIWAWLIVISIKYHQRWTRKRPCELIKVGTGKGHWPESLLRISPTKKSSFHSWTLDLFYRFFICKIVLTVHWHWVKWANRKHLDVNKNRDNNGAWTEPINTFTDQPYIANSILNYEMEIDDLCPRQRWMNGWVRTESVNVYLPSVVAQSF